MTALHTALLGALATAFTTSSIEARTALALVLTGAAAAFSILAVVYAALAAKPQTGGPDTSLIFFGRIQAMSPSEYYGHLKTADDEVLLADCASQIHRNAEIASIKHGHLAGGITSTFISGATWAAAIALLVKF